MKTSSATQLNLELLDAPGFAGRGSYTPQFISRQSSDTAPGDGPIKNLPGGSSAAAYAVNARLAGRQAALQTKPAEYEALLAERQSLLDKKLSGNMTREEENRLAYVRWSLDRIEDARYGQSLDEIEDLVSRYERVLGELDGLRVELQKHRLLR